MVLRKSLGSSYQRKFHHSSSKEVLSLMIAHYFQTGTGSLHVYPLIIGPYQSHVTTACVCTRSILSKLTTMFMFIPLKFFHKRGSNTFKVKGLLIHGLLSSHLHFQMKSEGSNIQQQQGL